MNLNDSLSCLVKRSTRDLGHLGLDQDRDRMPHRHLDHGLVLGPNLVAFGPERDLQRHVTVAALMREPGRSDIFSAEACMTAPWRSGDIPEHVEPCPGGVDLDAGDPLYSIAVRDERTQQRLADLGRTVPAGSTKLIRMRTCQISSQAYRRIRREVRSKMFWVYGDRDHTRPVLHLMRNPRDHPRSLFSDQSLRQNRPDVVGAEHALQSSSIRLSARSQPVRTGRGRDDESEAPAKWEWCERGDGPMG